MNKKQFTRDFMDAIWNGQNFDEVAKYVHPSYTIYLDTGDPWEGQTINHQLFKERLKHSFNSFPDIHFEITTCIEELEHVSITWILTGTNLGAINQYPPTGKKIRTNGVTIYHFNENKISGHTQIFDRTTVMKQLGFG